MKDTLLEEQMVHINPSITDLIENALQNNEGTLSANKAFCVETGERTGRSTNDRFIVYDAETANNVAWGKINQKFSTENFEKLWTKAEEYLTTKHSYVSHLRIGADDDHYLPVEVITEYAWHNLFARNLFIRPNEHFAGNKEVWKILSVPNFKTDPQIDQTNSDGTLIINFTAKRILICGLRYAGEIKKSMFSVMNYIMPSQDVLPMHCASNVDIDGKNSILLFGLSGTGKTTLSADPERLLIGDDEHGWSEKGIFNFEGGCYAKCINLSQKNEPLIWDAIRSGAVMENVVLDQDKQADYNDDSLTQNTRVAYPREYITTRAKNNFADHPVAVIFLCCDLYSVLPPVAKLTREQAAYYFLSGYTALVGSTEVGQTEAIKPTFSTCFGAPFFPRSAKVYADLLTQRLEKTDTPVYLVNTGWSGGSYGKGGERFPIPVTRSVIKAILANDFSTNGTSILPNFNIEIPNKLAGVDDDLLDPRTSWQDANKYQKYAKILIDQFIENFKKFDVDEKISSAGPDKI